MLFWFHASIEAFNKDFWNQESEKIEVAFVRNYCLHLNKT